MEMSSKYYPPDEDNIRVCRVIGRKPAPGGLVGVIPEQGGVAAETMRWGFMVEQVEGYGKDKFCKIKVTPYTVASHPLGPLNILGD